MIQIAIVEDDNRYYQLLKRYLDEYEKKNEILFKTSYFKDGLDFLNSFRSEYDLVLLDIEMPYMDGMELAHKIREVDQTVTLIFVTNMKQFAVNGYEVGALDFIVKPIGYYDFALKLKKAISVINSRKEIDCSIYVNKAYHRISSKEIMYFEVYGHNLDVHTETTVYHASGRVSEMEEKFKDASFMRCHNSFLINPKYIQSVKTNSVVMMDGREIQVPRPRKKAFMQELATWMGNGKNL